jgi:uncharacterized protein (TIGR03083 family)
VLGGTKAVAGVVVAVRPAGSILWWPERRRQAAAGPDAVVPTAPEWTTADLVAHVGQTQHWVAEIVERRITDPAQLPTGFAAPPADPRDWPAWLSGSAQRFVTACSDDALDAPVFNAAADHRSGARFWLTTLLNEAVIHGADAAAAEPTDRAAALITNHLAMLTSPTWSGNAPPRPRPSEAPARPSSGRPPTPNPPGTSNATPKKPSGNPVRTRPT